MQDARFFRFLTAMGLLCLQLLLGSKSALEQPVVPDHPRVERGENLDEGWYLDGKDVHRDLDRSTLRGFPADPAADAVGAPGRAD
jgi:hypothetical protein